ncbi:MAG: hypothetical protein NVS9B11_17900 [Candidatus Dormibacteraceae bacterium]
MPIRIRRSTHRIRALVALSIIVLVLLGTTSATALAYSSMKDQGDQLQVQLTAHLQAAQKELEAAKASLKLANNNHSEVFIVEARVHFTTAKVHFGLARQIADGSDLLNRLESVPGIGGMARSRHDALDGIADMGAAVTDAGQILADLDSELIKPAGSKNQGGSLLTTLDQTHKSMIPVRAAFARAQKAGALVDVHVLPASQQGAFIKSRETITAALTAIDEFERLVPVITEMLGGNGSRRYLVEQVNPAELRAGGGFLGTYSILQADHGTLKLIKSGNSYDFAPAPRPGPGQPGYVTPPGPLREYILIDKGWSFMDSNVYPDFPSNAQAAKNFVEPRIGMSVDGVIAMDYYTVAKLLEVTGPINVPLFGTINSQNFVAEVVERGLVLGDLTHKTLTSSLAGPLMERVSTLPSNKWPILVALLNDMASARHLQAYFNSPIVEKEMERIGWSGTLNPTKSKDWMMAVESNLGASKANYFVTRKYTLELYHRGPTLFRTLKVDITNNATWDLHPNEFYRAYLELYTSDNAGPAGTTLRPPRYANSPPPPGTRLTSGWAPFMPGYGSTTRNVYEFNAPWHADSRGQATIYWQKQPGADARTVDTIEVDWFDDSGHKYTATGDLAQDRVITFSTHGVTIGPGQKAQATLPSLTLG